MVLQVSNQLKVGSPTLELKTLGWWSIYQTQPISPQLVDLLPTQLTTASNSSKSNVPKTNISKIQTWLRYLSTKAWSTQSPTTKANRRLVSWPKCHSFQFLNPSRELLKFQKKLCKLRVIKLLRLLFRRRTIKKEEIFLLEWSEMDPDQD